MQTDNVARTDKDKCFICDRKRHKMKKCWYCDVKRTLEQNEKEENKKMKAKLGAKKNEDKDTKADTKTEKTKGTDAEKKKSSVNASQ